MDDDDRKVNAKIGIFGHSLTLFCSSCQRKCRWFAVVIVVVTILSKFRIGKSFRFSRIASFFVDADPSQIFAPHILSVASVCQSNLITVKEFITQVSFILVA